MRSMRHRAPASTPAHRPCPPGPPPIWARRLFCSARSSSILRQSSRRRASSLEQLVELLGGAPALASAARAGSGSSRICLRSSVAPRLPPATGPRSSSSPPGAGGLTTSCPAYLATNAATFVGVVADDDVLGHDRAGEAAVADRVDHVGHRLLALVEVRALHPLAAVGAPSRTGRRRASGSPSSAQRRSARPRRSGRCRDLDALRPATGGGRDHGDCDQ